MKVYADDGGLVEIQRAGLTWPNEIGSDAFRRYDLDIGQLTVNDFETVCECNPWAWAAVQAIARTAARMPQKVYVDKGDTRERVAPGPVGAAARLARSLQQPMPGRSGKGMRMGTIADRVIHGNALWPFTIVDGSYQFERVPWREVRVDQRNGRVDYVERCGARRRFNEDEVIHFGKYAGRDVTHAGGVINMSPFSALRATLKLHRLVVIHLISFFEKGARPSGHLKLDKSAKADVIKLVRDELEKLYQGAENAGRPLVTSGEWQQITANPDQSQVIALAHESREEIAAALSVPPPVIGILDRAIKSNVVELKSSFVRDSVGPVVEFFDDDFMAQLVRRDPALANTIVETDPAAQLKPDIEARAKAFKDLLYVYSQNELRRIDNLPPIDDPAYDKPWPAPTTSEPTDDSSPSEKDDDQEDDDAPE